MAQSPSLLPPSLAYHYKEHFKDQDFISQSFLWLQLSMTGVLARTWELPRGPITSQMGHKLMPSSRLSHGGGCGACSLGHRLLTRSLPARPGRTALRADTPLWPLLM